MNENLFTKRVYGIQIIRSKNSNYNADFTGNPRTLSDGSVYSTDKVNKFNIRKYLGRNDPDGIFVKESIHSFLKNNTLTTGPRTLVETYKFFFCREDEQVKDHSKIDILKNLLTKLDIRFFGATFAPGGDDVKGKNVSIHGPVQISYATNRYLNLKDSGSFTDQIRSPYASESGDSQTTLGTQTRSQEAHYIHHFSINPKNLIGYVKQFEETQKDFQLLSTEDISLLKQAMAVGTTYYDSTTKKDCENELLFWMELKEGSEKILRNFTELINVSSQEDGRTQIDFSKVKKYLDHFQNDISKIEVYYDDDFTDVISIPANCDVYKELNSVFETEK
jgi:CRISPR-associated protein Csh2